MIPVIPKRGIVGTVVKNARLLRETGIMILYMKLLMLDKDHDTANIRRGLEIGLN